ncbi:glycerol-3-phosphate dehydrogenase [Mycoplasmopsis maculosa]|uniref:Glycerol-3-phosphate dehydrogenase n=1 Tax=Mycoplasmopsis maculosa TaxID=114885 RepID=A0A449B574_9BACT|nr:NAD(P)H-dependent glycerol-3-phosphate dehydrogenase [Mycoplasmopsis maculosa]VEU75678.1 glycerol-3-phosphate dehydrogenase [Mycoplasmopsis maculosa]
MSNITFIGTGAFASALATTLSLNNHKILMWGIDKKEVEDINNGVNSKYFSNINFNNKNNIRATLDLQEALLNTEYLIIAIPSSAIKSVSLMIREIIKERKINIINVSKGIDKETKKFFSEVFYSYFGKNINNFCSLIGPSFADEVFENKLTIVNAVGENITYLKEISELFSNQYFRVVANDNKGLELFAALKNILAIGMGISSKIYPGKNPQAALLTIGINDINEIYKSMFPNVNENSILSFCGFGDIVLTCLNDKSRNYSFGASVADLGIKEALLANSKTVEGYFNSKILLEFLNENSKIKAPFLRKIVEILNEKTSLENLLDFIKNY